ncbi:sigma-54-dependent transcriptional regulator [Moritella viscosa]|uniref:Response regulator n=1 Tax=Moritella viscosa TaxID=80854 RepID=A0A090I990_9GAMM|nr:sigma-54 dependent transcriptional regulator [Moritella viscosa]CED58266.1 TRAP-type C4-dicarboxylate transport sigma 54-dependent response regulator [Moritella viscosa]SGY94710.1 Response regulator [Moritella viscosa]SGY99822.1 Response regulator [Moritella viscosa]SGZ00272.1 Response regulator [Moritella viscosa]SGZ06281.1 Response regulator [Moritella viscosa]
MSQVFFIDDEEDLRIANQQTLELAGINVTCFSDAESALAQLAVKTPLVVITDIRLPGLSGHQLLLQLRQQDPSLPVILITGHGDISLAVQAMHDGAYDFIEKPFASVRLTESVKRAMEKRILTEENRTLKKALQAKETLGPRIIGTTTAIVELREMISHIADTPADILLFGETGTGKELVARSLHEQSSRRTHNFVAINCGAVPENLIESELFGHEKGAFSGASERRIGKFEYAQGGTLFLDEIESMPMPAQIKLLRILQERTLERIGSNKEIPLDIRIIAATKVDLTQAANAGTFRQDLYYRLNIVTLNLPPLRQRFDDIQSLFHHFLLVSAARYSKAAPALPLQDVQTLLAHDWPGNVRELRNAAERYILLGKLTGLSSVNEAQPTLTQNLSEQVETFEKILIEQALTSCNGSIKDTMHLLNLARKTLYDKMQKHQIDKHDFKDLPIK